MSELQSAIDRLKRDQGEGLVSVVDTDDLLKVLEAASSAEKGYQAYYQHRTAIQKTLASEGKGKRAFKTALEVVSTCLKVATHKDESKWNSFVIVPSNELSQVLKRVRG